MITTINEFRKILESKKILDTIIEDDIKYVISKYLEYNTTTYLTYILVNIYLDNQNVGSLYLKPSTNNGYCAIGRIEINAKFRRLGIYTKTLLTISKYIIDKKIGIGLFSFGGQRSTDADYFWESFITKYPERVTKQNNNYYIK